MFIVNKTITIATISVLVAVMMITSVALPAMAMIKVDVCKDGQKKTIGDNRLQKFLDDGWVICEMPLVSAIHISGSLTSDVPFPSESNAFAEWEFDDNGAPGKSDHIVPLFEPGTVAFDTEIVVDPPASIDDMVIVVVCDNGDSFFETVEPLDLEVLSGTIEVKCNPKGKGSTSFSAEWVVIPSE